MGVQQHVGLDVLQDVSFEGMPHHTHHKYNGAINYVCVDVLSEGSLT
jgi:hypothetical protein